MWFAEHFVSSRYQDKDCLLYCGQESLHHVTPVCSNSLIYGPLHISQIRLPAIPGVLAIPQIFRTLLHICNMVFLLTRILPSTSYGLSLYIVLKPP